MIFLIIWLILLIINTPMAFSLGIASLIGLLLSNGQLQVIPQRIVGGMDSFLLLAIPLFIFVGNIANTGGITERIFNLANALVGHIKGGLGHVNVVASMIFAGMSGSMSADTAGLGRMEIEAMSKAGFDTDFSLGITCASAIIGPIIPPSITFIIYGMLSNTSIGALFLGGFLPGLLIGLSLMVQVYFIAKKRKYLTLKKFSLKNIVDTFKASFLSLFTPIIIIGGIFFGIFTPTEAAAVAASYSVILTVLIYREINFKQLFEIIIKTMESTAIIIIIVGMASLFGWVLTIYQIPQKVAYVILKLVDTPLSILIIINIFMIFVGCFMEAIAAMTILVPIFMPMILSLGIDPVHFGLILAINLGIGSLTPPVGISLYVAADIVKWPITRVTKAVLPFYIPICIVLLLIILFPEIVLFIPRLFLG